MPEAFIGKVLHCFANYLLHFYIFYLSFLFRLLCLSSDVQLFNLYWAQLVAYCYLVDRYSFSASFARYWLGTLITFAVERPARFSKIFKG